VRVTVEQRGSTVAFAVADTGSGIAAEALPHVFDRFWKSADSGGSGLGLAICRWVAEAHRGRIEVSSRVGAGSTFRIRLPAGRPDS
jgi:two-component system sensor histidine kinase BaeS